MKLIRIHGGDLTCPARVLMIGKTISHYRIIARLGEGGMGVVYKAEDTKLKRMVALKFLSSSKAASEDDQARFLREARAAAALDHPNICGVYETGEAEGQVFIAMAYIDGESLEQRIKSRAVGLAQALDLAAQAADGLAAAHSKGIVHRDIKPANLMITPSGQVKIMDFGLAKLAEATRLTKPGDTLETLAYMSPEQARGEEADHRSDIWSVGVVLYEMLTGRRPFEGAYSQAVIYSILNEKVPPLSSVLPDVPKELEGLLDCCLAKEPDDRFRTADKLSSALRSIKLEESGVATATAVGVVPKSPRKPPATPSDYPREIAGYKILQCLGEGGMGMVYLAEQEKPVRRRVALKIIKLGMDTKEVVARFESERQALAMMSHPNIARIFNAGATEEGRPYFAMEYVPGETLTEYCDKHRLSIRERLELFIHVCRAIHHAHQKAIIHRDIKPTNILVMIQDGKPVPKVIDFGVAKATTQHLTERTVFTEFGELVGTPEYMSPEQLEMTGLDVDTTTDVYSLGVLLYELLVGALPFDPKTLREAGWDGLRRLIREVDPPHPSTRITMSDERAAEAAARRRTESRMLRKLVEGELDWITMRAIEKDRTRRYQSASEFAADIERYLSDEPIQASPPSTAYRLLKFVRRHRVPVAAAAAIALTIVVLGSVAFWQGRIAQERGAQARANGILASAAATDDSFLKALLVLELANSPQLPGRLTVAREAADHPLPTAVLQAHNATIRTVAFAPDGEHFATAASDGLVKIWQSNDLSEPVVLRGHMASVERVAFAPDGTRIVSGSDDSTARVWRTDGVGEPLILRGHRAAVRGVAVSPDGTLVATASGDSTARIWASDGTGESVILEHGDAVTDVEFSPDGTRVATACYDGAARIWQSDGRSEPIVLRGHESNVHAASFSPDGTLVVTASDDSTARIWRSDGSGRPVVLRQTDQVYEAVFAPDGSWVATCGGDGTVWLWPADGKGEPTVLSGHEGWVRHMAVSTDGSRLVTVGHGQDRSVKIWHTDGTTEPFTLCQQEAEVTAADFSPDGSQIVTTSGDGALRLWDAGDTGESILLSYCWETEWYGPFSPDGSRIAFLSHDGLVQTRAADGTGEALTIGQQGADVTSAEFSPDGTRLAVGSRDGAVRIWRTDGGGEIAALRGHDGPILDASFSPDGARVVATGADGRIIVWPADGTGEPLVLADLDERSIDASFTPDGEHLIASAISDGQVLMWQVDGRGEPVVLLEQDGLADNRLSPDGSRLVTLSNKDNAVRIWRLAGTEPPTLLQGHSNDTWSVEFSPDGKSIVTTSWDFTVRIWDVDTGRETLVLHADKPPFYAEFTPNGKCILVDFGVESRIMRVTWDGLEEYLRSRIGGCLTPEQRMRYLGESSPEAWRAYEEWERHQGRRPIMEKPQ
jgi:WD40 repeat protein/serine/threonine protein kinase